MAKSNSDIFKAINRSGAETRTDLKTVHTRLDGIQKDNSDFRETQAEINGMVKAHVGNTAIHVNPESKPKANGWTPQKVGAAIGGGLMFFGTAVYGIVKIVEKLASG